LFTYAQYDVVSGDRVLTKKVVTDNLESTPIVFETSYAYNEKLQLTNTVERRSDGRREVLNVSYPIDYASGTAFLDDMKTANILSFPVEKVAYKETDTSRTIVSGEIIKYRGGGKGAIDEVLNLNTLAPIDLALFKFSNRAMGVLPPAGTQTVFGADARYDSRLIYDNYDLKGNPLQYTLTNNQSTSYLWDHLDQYPVAEVRNAVHTDIAYAGFEGQGKGNWSYTGATTADPSVPVGRRRYSLSAGSLSKTGLTASRNYVLEYWIKGSTQPSVTGSGLELGGVILLGTKDGWSHFRRSVSGSTALTISGSAVIDEVRLYPVESQMTTYTYEPLIGVMSETDVSGKTAYYEYDNALRLKHIKDQEGKLLKTYDYHYKE